MAVKQLRAVAGGRDRLVGFWHGPETGSISTLFGIAREARNSVEGLHMASEMINGNARLSPQAKSEDFRQAAKDRLYLLGRQQEKLNSEKARIQERVSQLSAVKPYRDGDFSSVQIDIALAAQLKAMSSTARNTTLQLGEKAYVDAVLRLPRELTGVDAEHYGMTQRQALARANPREAQELEELLRGVDDAQDALRTAFELVAADGKFNLVDRVAAAGEGAETLIDKGVSPGTVERIKDRLDAAREGRETDPFNVEPKVDDKPTFFSAPEADAPAAGA